MPAPPPLLLLGVGVGEGAGLRGRLHGAVAVGGCSAAVLWGSWEEAGTPLQHCRASPPPGCAPSTHLQWHRGRHRGVRWEEGSRQGSSGHVLGGQEVSGGLGEGAVGGSQPGGSLPCRRCPGKGGRAAGPGGPPLRAGGGRRGPRRGPALCPAWFHQQGRGTGGWGERGRGAGDTGGWEQQGDVGLGCSGRGCGVYRNVWGF